MWWRREMMFHLMIWWLAFVDCWVSFEVSSVVLSSCWPFLSGESWRFQALYSSFFFSEINFGFILLWGGRLIKLSGICCWCHLTMALSDFVKEVTEYQIFYFEKIRVFQAGGQMISCFLCGLVSYGRWEIAFWILLAWDKKHRLCSCLVGFFNTLK